MTKNLLLLILLLITACSKDSITDKIVIVNIQNYDRRGIAEQILNIRSLNPKVIALDVQFSTLKDRVVDSLLRAALLSCDNLVMASLIGNYTHQDIEYQDTLGLRPLFFDQC